MLIMKLLNVSNVKGLEKKVDAIVSNKALSKSQKMKDLFQLGLEIKDIAEALGVRYNFVYNVISNYIIIESLEVETTKQTSKKDLVRDLYNQGKTNKEISIELKTNYNYVYKLVKEIKDEIAKAKELAKAEETTNVAK